MTIEDKIEKYLSESDGLTQGKIIDFVMKHFENSYSIHVVRGSRIKQLNNIKSDEYITVKPLLRSDKIILINTNSKDVLNKIKNGIENIGDVRQNKKQYEIEIPTQGNSIKENFRRFYD